MDNRKKFPRSLGFLACGAAALFGGWFLKKRNGVGRGEGTERGPMPGHGAVIHESYGEADFDGLPGDELPPTKDANRDRPYRPDRAAD